jgi:hypothetical protein
MNYFEQAQIRLNDWVNETPERAADFARMTSGRSVQQYLALYAYKPDIVAIVVKQLMEYEAARVTKRINAV